MNITLIKFPPFMVDFSPPPVPASSEPLSLIFKGFKDALNEAKSNAGASFKAAVLNYDEANSEYYPPTDIWLFTYRIATWILEMIWGVTSATISPVLKKILNTKPVHPLVFYNAALNMNHLRTKEEAFDSSHVPEEIQIDLLIEIFKGINFSDST